MSVGPPAGFGGGGGGGGVQLQLDVAGASQMALNFGLATLKQFALAGVYRSSPRPVYMS